MKKRVLILPDVEGWAYDIIAQHITPHFERYVPTIKYFRDIISGADTVSFANYDVIFAFFWYDGFSRMDNIRDFNISKCCVGVHSHNSWMKRNIPLDQVKMILKQYPAIGCTSEKLLGIFKDHGNAFLSPSAYAPEYFQPSPLPRFDGKLKVAWAGDPMTAHHGDVKGFSSIIKPVIDELDEIELISQTKQMKIPYHQMSKFYQKAHVYINMSLNEGSPQPVIEAMACGRPVISTDVGIVPEYVNDQNGLIINRDREGLREALLDLHSRTEELTQMGIMARKAIEDRTWAWAAGCYERLFDGVVDAGDLNMEFNEIMDS